MFVDMEKVHPMQLEDEVPVWLAHARDSRLSQFIRRDNHPLIDTMDVAGVCNVVRNVYIYMWDTCKEKQDAFLAHIEKEVPVPHEPTNEMASQGIMTIAVGDYIFVRDIHSSGKLEDNVLQCFVIDLSKEADPQVAGELDKVQEAIMGDHLQMSSEQPTKVGGQWAGGTRFERDERATPVRNTKRAYTCGISGECPRNLAHPPSCTKVDPGVSWEEDEFLHLRQFILRKTTPIAVRKFRSNFRRIYDEISSYANMVNCPRIGCHENTCFTSLQINLMGAIAHQSMAGLSDLGSFGEKHIDNKDCPCAYTCMFCKSNLPKGYDGGRFHLVELGVYVDLNKPVAIYFQGLRYHSGTPVRAPPGAAVLSGEVIHAVGAQPSGRPAEPPIGNAAFTALEDDVPPPHIVSTGKQDRTFRLAPEMTLPLFDDTQQHIQSSESNYAQDGIIIMGEYSLLLFLARAIVQLACALLRQLPFAVAWDIQVDADLMLQSISFRPPNSDRVRMDPWPLAPTVHTGASVQHGERSQARNECRDRWNERCRSAARFIPSVAGSYSAYADVETPPPETANSYKRNGKGKAKEKGGGKGSGKDKGSGKGKGSGQHEGGGQDKGSGQDKGGSKDKTKSQPRGFTKKKSGEPGEDSLGHSGMQEARNQSIWDIHCRSNMEPLPTHVDTDVGNRVDLESGAGVGMTPSTGDVRTATVMLTRSPWPASPLSSLTSSSDDEDNALDADKFDIGNEDGITRDEGNEDEDEDNMDEDEGGMDEDGDNEDDGSIFEPGNDDGDSDDTDDDFVDYGIPDGPDISTMNMIGIKDRRVSDGKLEYHVQWDNRQISSSWEKPENLREHSFLLDRYNNQNDIILHTTSDIQLSDIDLSPHATIPDGDMSSHGSDEPYLNNEFGHGISKAVAPSMIRSETAIINKALDALKKNADVSLAVPTLVDMASQLADMAGAPTSSNALYQSRALVHRMATVQRSSDAGLMDVHSSRAVVMVAHLQVYRWSVDALEMTVRTLWQPQADVPESWLCRLLHRLLAFVVDASPSARVGTSLTIDVVDFIPDAGFALPYTITRGKSFWDDMKEPHRSLRVSALALEALLQWTGLSQHGDDGLSLFRAQVLLSLVQAAEYAGISDLHALLMLPSVFEVYRQPVSETHPREVNPITNKQRPTRRTRVDYEAWEHVRKMLRSLPLFDKQHPQHSTDRATLDELTAALSQFASCVDAHKMAAIQSPVRKASTLPSFPTALQSLPPPAASAENPPEVDGINRLCEYLSEMWEVVGNSVLYNPLSQCQKTNVSPPLKARQQTLLSNPDKFNPFRKLAPSFQILCQPCGPYDTGHPLRTSNREAWRRDIDEWNQFYHPSDHPPGYWCNKSAYGVPCDARRPEIAKRLWSRLPDLVRYIDQEAAGFATDSTRWSFHNIYRFILRRFEACGKLTAFLIVSDLVDCGLDLTDQEGRGVPQPSDVEMASIIQFLKSGARRGLIKLNIIGSTVDLSSANGTQAYISFCERIRAATRNHPMQPHISCLLPEYALCKVQRREVMKEHKGVKRVSKRRRSSSRTDEDAQKRRKRK
ncbi:hypothetical protein FISHEDRAFT_73921 [Fistulina hepatica ATCC 64428]|uniref:Chromo domain-containing protein n=1 Tax=Fistulina hepatica ATCC 64428 TaxID=1128425 RepID=A0A0D7AAW6_9AGAR|nr:hypothetical protein FISHEDRAFT_73921 [Fistulina hepatica ATCC 64428]